ncbi:MAG: hypothetical protein B6D39_05080 [Anaerolineae bacterium UTCFX2]|jgi:uncharacterized membrane protein YfcA|nr:CvpA family protein [Anaerolineae bacterium]MCZ7551211.1 CvpA family protein [Anaerolineales bacterium]OQY92198.1 MAG: hypothetical protein B6D39_05080 [Anaerolineae bacterium UTCFX2]
MIAFVAFFFIFLIFFGFIGTVRGWAKEFLVIVSVILALAFITLMEDLVGLRNNLLSNPSVQYWFRIIVIAVLVFFGYLSPSLPRFQKASEKRARISEHILGFFIGMISGFFVIGTLWSFASQANYPNLERFIRPVPNELVELNNAVMNILPPVWLNSPTVIFIVVVLTFIFAMIYFL